MEEFYSLDTDQRIALVRKAMEAGQPLMIRWAKLESNFGIGWHQRAAAAADWLAEASSVADLGCGNMSLEQYLRAGQRYIPVDLVERDTRTIVIDLNKESELLKLPDADACALLGVIEYSYAPDQLLAALSRKYERVVASFNIYDDAQSFEFRLANGWVTHFRNDELIEAFLHYGFSLIGQLLIAEKRREYLFAFRKEA